MWGGDAVQILPWGMGWDYYFCAIRYYRVFLATAVAAEVGVGGLRVVSRGCVVRVYNVLKRSTNSLWFYECNFII